MTMLVIVSCYADLTVFLCCCYNNKEDKLFWAPCKAPGGSQEMPYRPACLPEDG